ncbi:MAG: RluA family pseudouridine synthase [Betaproteobacteria bacterium]|nr:RluA family pseudouridine synthase [Betaproteobacteria bacterium]
MKENYTAPDDEADWEDAFVAALTARVPRELGGLRLDQALAKVFPQYSRNRLQALLKSGHILVDGRAAQPSLPVAGTEVVELRPPPAVDVASPRAQKMALDIVYQDPDLIVINKPAGLVVHPGAGNPEGTLMNGLLAHAAELRQVPRAGIVHRLDRDTSGLLVVAGNVSAQANLAAQLAARTVKRRYLALVHGDPPGSGTVDAPIGRDPKLRTRMMVAQRGKEARTRFRVLGRFGHCALIECTLDTGRTHQIRVHLQHIRHPLVGDPVYRRGTRRAVAFPRQALHAAELELLHPRTGKRIGWSAPPPADMRQLIARLQRDG